MISLPHDSWFKLWMDAHTHVEPPDSFKLLAAMAMFGACVGRSVWYDHDGVRKLFPMLNLLLIGPSGIGKSYAIDMGLETVRTLPDPLRPQLIYGSTPEKLHEDLSIKPHAILIASELANFFNKQKYMDGMIPYVTELLDYRGVEKRTRTGGITRIDEPAVSIVGGSTVEWLQDQLPDSAGAGGFLARFFIVKESFKGRKDPLPLYSSSTERERLSLLHSQSLSSFGGYVAHHSGPIEWDDYDTAERYSFWYSNHQPESGALSPFSARAGEFVIRLSILSALSRGLHSITIPDLECGISLYDLMIRNLQSVVVSFTPQGKLIAKVMETLKLGPRSQVEIRRGMRNYCGSRETDTFIQSLIDSGDVYKTAEGRYALHYRAL